MENLSLSDSKIDALNRVKVFAMECILNNAHKAIYHDIRYGQRLAKNITTISDALQITSESKRVLTMCGWLYTSTFTSLPTTTKIKEEREEEGLAYIDSTLVSELSALGVKPEVIDEITAILKHVIRPAESQSTLSGILMDAIMMDLSESDSLGRVKKLYEEAVLSDVNLSLGKFYDLCVQHFSEYNGHTPYGKEKLVPSIISLLEKVEKEKRKLSRKKSILLKKELEISDEELKELRKNLDSVKGRDARGVQTLFRTTSRNHYTLNEMVDRKANIMITVNAIILSVVIGGFLGRSATDSIFAVLPLVILSLSSLFSIIFAVLSITPNRTQGQFTKEEILNKEGNLLYFGNFHNMKFRDYEWGMLEKLNDSNFLYSSMIKDLYYLGKSLHRKYAFIRISLQFFVIGLVSSFVIFMLGRVVVFI